MARMMFWTCPVRAHGQRRAPEGHVLPTVSWENEVASCLTPGCTLTSTPGETLIEAIVYYPSGTGPATDYLNLPLNPRDFAATVVASRDGLYQVRVRNGLVDNENYRVETMGRGFSAEDRFLFPLEHAKHVAATMANISTMNGKNYHEWCLEACS